MAGRRHAMNESKLNEMASAIYGEVYGADNKFEAAERTQEIYDWLATGDLDGSETIEFLVAEWNEYTKDEDLDKEEENF
jgi:hypothetical protein